MNKRIIVSPIVFLVGCFMTFAGMFLPIPIIMAFGAISLISIPFIQILKWSGLNIDNFDLMVSPTEFHSVNSILNIILPIWLPFYYTYYYIINSKLLF